MSLVYTPEIREIVETSCKDLIDQYRFCIEQKGPNLIFLTSENCGIRICAGISPIGERQIDFDFFDPRRKPDDRKMYADFDLLNSPTRSEPRDIMDSCPEEKDSFDDTVRDALECFTRHTLKYRKDILGGDFTSWIPHSTR